MTNTTALQVTNFNFYGDELIALKDNATGEIYTSINAVLRGIGFTDADQIRKKRDKWINDTVISKGIQKFNIPTQEGVTKKDTPINNQEVFCISQRKLPLALAKINITPKMKKEQPELASRLELYQDKCADVLAAVFIDGKSIGNTRVELLEKKLDRIMDEQEKILLRVNSPELSEYKSLWLKNTLSDLGQLQLFLKLLNKNNLLPFEFMPANGIISFSWTIHIVIAHAEEINSDIVFNQYQRKFQSETGCICKRALDFIEYYKETKGMFTESLESMLNMMLNILKTAVKEEKKNSSVKIGTT